MTKMKYKKKNRNVGQGRFGAKGEGNKTVAKKMRIKCDVVGLKTAVMSIRGVLCSSDRCCSPDITQTTRVMAATPTKEPRTPPRGRDRERGGTGRQRERESEKASSCASW